MFNMTRKTKLKTKTGEKEVIIYLLPASQGITMAKRLGEIFLPALGTVLESQQTDMGIDWSEASLALAANLGDLQVETEVKQLLNGCTINMQDVHASFDQYFMGNYGELLGVIKFALEENFGSFFDSNDFLKSLAPMTQTITAE